MSKTRQRLKTLLALGFGLALIALGVFAAFVAGTTNPNNKFESGTVAVGSDVSGAIYSEIDKKPGDVVSKCIKVTYTGSVAATIKAYVTSGVTNGTLYNLKIEQGTQTTGVRPDCGDFAPTATVKADGPMSTLATDYTGGYDIKGSAFAQNDNVTLRYTITHNDDTTENGHTSATGTGLHTWKFEAHSN